MLIFAHRGFSDRWTSENTLEAFGRALQHPVDGIECDVRISRDRAAIICHDKRLDRLAGDGRRVCDLTVAELKELVLRSEGSIPTLNDVTAAIPSPFQIDFEIKDKAAVEPLIAKLKTSASLRERAIVSSFSVEAVKRLKIACPEVRTMILKRTWPLPWRKERFWQQMKTLNVWGVGFPARSLTKKRIIRVRKQGLKIALWDVQRVKKETARILKLAPDIAIIFDCRRSVLDKG